METNLVAEGLKLMAVGMSVVFVFLLVLIAAMKLLSAFVARFQPPEARTDEQALRRKKAAIAAASLHHYKRHT